MLARYGPVALGVYLVIFVLTMAGFWTAIRLGYRPDSVSGTAGTLGAAWLATKLTQPLRIAATVLLTPLLAAGLARVRGRGEGAGASGAGDRDGRAGGGS